MYMISFILWNFIYIIIPIYINDLLEKNLGSLKWSYYCEKFWNKSIFLNEMHRVSHRKSNKSIIFILKKNVFYKSCKALWIFQKFVSKKKNWTLQMRFLNMLYFLNVMPLSLSWLQIVCLPHFFFRKKLVHTDTEYFNLHLKSCRIPTIKF